MNEHVTVRRGQRHLDAIRLQFGAAIEEAAWQTDDQVTVTVALNSLPEVVETLYYGHEGWLATIVATGSAVHISTARNTWKHSASNAARSGSTENGPPCWISAIGPPWWSDATAPTAATSMTPA